MSIASSDSHACPRFVALSFDEYVEADSDLDVLLRILADLADPSNPEDLAVWDGARIAAVVRGDGTVTRFDGAHADQPSLTTRSNP